MKNCIFVRNLNSGEPAYYCGNVENKEDLMFGIKNIIEAEVESWLEYSSNEDCQLQFTSKFLTQEQIDNLPDV